MRRLAAAALVLFAVVGALIASGQGGSGAKGYRVDAIFDNADFLVKGQQVKISGAEVGEVQGVHLTRDRRARVEMTITKGFDEFRTDATCSIRPESLIGEKFVECDPGSPNGEPLRGPGGSSGTPTVPLDRTSSPVSLDLVFATLRLPYRQRLAILVNELGTGLAGRPEDLNAAIRRANPALKRANEVLTIVNEDRRTLAKLIDESDRVIEELSDRRGEVASFIDRADRVAQSVASRRGDLALAIDRLPPLLAELEPAAAELGAFASEARPVARDLRDAAEPLRALLADFDPLTEAARPTLRALDELSVTGRRTVRSLTPVAQKLLPIAHQVPETADLADALTASLRDRGAVEGLMRFLYLAAAAGSRFDRYSHILPSYQITGPCQQHTTTPVAGCSARWRGDGGGGLPGAPGAAQRRGGAGANSGNDRGREESGAPSSGGREPRSPEGRGGSAAPGNSPLPSPAENPAQQVAPSPEGGGAADQILDFLLGP